MDVAITQQHDVLLGAKLAVQQGVVVEHPRLHARVVVGFAKTSRVGELKTDHEVLVVPHGFAMRLHQGLSQPGNVSLGAGVHHQLSRVGTAVMAHSHGLAAPDHLRARQTEMPPTAACVVAGAAISVTIPALHGVHGKAVADGERADLQGLSHDRFGTRLKRFIAGHVQAQTGQVVFESCRAGQGFDFDKVTELHGCTPRCARIITSWLLIAKVLPADGPCQGDDRRRHGQDADPGHHW
jgi:hypothetical protein